MSAADAPSAAEERRPNILLVVTDQEQWQSLPFQFDFAKELPARDRLRRSSVQFTNHFDASSPCTPSRAAIYTGKHLQQNGVPDNFASLDPREAVTVGGMLSACGYDCHYRGKFHLDKSLLSKPKAQLDPRVHAGDAALEECFREQAAATRAGAPPAWRAGTSLRDFLSLPAGGCRVSIRLESYGLGPAHSQGFLELRKL